MSKFTKLKRILLISSLLIAVLLMGFTNVPEGTQEPESTPALDDPVPFSIAWVSDTQSSAYHKGEYKRISDWISEHQEEFNIRYVVGTGDYVGKGYIEEHWNEYNTFIDGIKDIPNMFVAGNHDLKGLKGDFSETFRQMDKGTMQIPEDQKYRDGYGKYALFSEGGIDWIMIGLSWGYRSDDINWLADVLDKFPDRKAILLFHDFLQPSGNLFSNGRMLVRAIKNRSGNARLALCGHARGKGSQRYDVMSDGSHYLRPILYNYQENKGKRGSVQILTFHPELGQVEMTAYFPLNPKGKPFHINYEMDFS